MKATWLVILLVANSFFIEANHISDVYGKWRVVELIAYPIGSVASDYSNYIDTIIEISGDEIKGSGNLTQIIDLRFQEYDPLLSGNLNSSYVMIENPSFIELYRDKFVLLTARLRYKNDYVGTGKTSDGYVYTNYAYINRTLMLVYGGGAVYRMVKVDK